MILVKLQSVPSSQKAFNKYSFLENQIQMEKKKRLSHQQIEKTMNEEFGLLKFKQTMLEIFVKTILYGD